MVEAAIYLGLIVFGIFAGTMLQYVASGKIIAAQYRTIQNLRMAITIAITHGGEAAVWLDEWAHGDAVLMAQVERRVEAQNARAKTVDPL